MNITSKPLALVLFVVMFGGITFSSALGWWQTESTKEPATFADGEFAGEANPADIRGSYTLGDIANSFDITPQILAQAFQVDSDDSSSFAVKELEVIYLDSAYEIGTDSVRLFVAFYCGLPFDTTGQEIYLPGSATDILLQQNNLNLDQQAYLGSFTADVKPAASPELEAAPASQAASTPVVESNPAETISEDYSIKGKTIFEDLIRWGVPQTTIEQIIGGSMPDPALKIKDYATANGLDFEALKTALQAEVDKVKPK